MSNYASSRVSSPIGALFYLVHTGLKKLGDVPHFMCTEEEVPCYILCVLKEITIERSYQLSLAEMSTSD